MKLDSKDLKNILKDNLVAVIGDFDFSTYSIDTRTINQGDIFIALIGEYKDSHDFIDLALSKEAKGLLINKSFYENNKEREFNNTIVVKDTLLALVDIAKYNVKHHQSQGKKIVGITGSVGKTTLKEMITFILSTDHEVASTFGNYNNHIGMPLSVAHISESSEFGVFEMGMSNEGEISYLSKILNPDIGIITEISEAHSESFIAEENKSSLDKIAEAKSEILEGLNKQGIVFFNKDNQYFDYLVNKAQSNGISTNNIFSFSNHDKGANVFIKAKKVLAQGKEYKIQVQASIFNIEVSYFISTLAFHNCLLSALSLGVAHVLGLDILCLAKKFNEFKIPQGRGSISSVTFNKQIFTMIDDAYNASPKSMESALSSLEYIQEKKIIILGDMLELGEIEVLEHKKLKNVIKKINNISKIILVGTLMKNLFEELKGSNIFYFNRSEDLLEDLDNIIDNVDVLFIKGSKGSRVSKISKHLQK